MPLKLEKIQRLKALFDHSSVELRQDYWTDELLRLYSETLGERIKWKWDSFLAELQSKELAPQNIFGATELEITDWGCGPGTASAAFANLYPTLAPSQFRFEDRSTLAQKFAERRIAQALRKSAAPSNAPAQKVLLISYVLSELGKTEESFLRDKILSYDAVLWVDAGTFKESRRLSEIRNTLLSDFNFFSPCPHQLTCPLTGEQNPHDWCHRFAKAPQEVFHSAFWADISKSLKIDLRSLPYSSLYGIKKKWKVVEEPLPVRLGRPRVAKHEITLDFCTPAGTYTREHVTKRQNPELFKKLRKE